MKAKRKGKKLEVLKATKKGVVDNFIVIETDENHHAIIDKYGHILSYQYHIKLELLETLKNSTSRLPRRQVKAGVRGTYPTWHYTVWRDHAIIPYQSSEFKRDLLASKEWCKQNENLFKYLSDRLWIISPNIYARYSNVRPYLEKEVKLKPLCGVWFGAAINEEITGSTSTHLD